MTVAEIIKPKFFLASFEGSGKVRVSICDAAVGYDMPFLSIKSFSVSDGDRVAVKGKNASGKSTLVRAILGDCLVKKSGGWFVPKPDAIGYLDQHYSTLGFHKTVIETVEDAVPAWPHADIRRHLNDFLFRKNEEVYALVETLSGGEKALLSLAQIAAKTPKLLILDEITNNLDMVAREHVIEAVNEYRGALIVISHDEDFLRAIGITQSFIICDGKLRRE